MSESKRLSASAQEAIRMRVVHYLQTKQGTQAQAAAAFMLSLSAVKKIWSRYLQQGETALQAHKRGPQKAVAHLKPQQVQKLCNHFSTTLPEHSGLPYPLWTAAAVRALIKKRLP